MPRPFAPGAEVAGIVSSIGPGTSDFRVGQRVAARIGTGGLAEFVVADVSRCSEIRKECRSPMRLSCSLPLRLHIMRCRTVHN